MLWVVICTGHLSVCSCHVTYASQSEFTLYTFLNVKEHLVWNKREIQRLSDCSWTRTHNNVAHKRTLNHLAKLAKWLSCVMSTYLYGAFDCMFLSCHVRVWEWIHTCSHLTFRFRAYFEQGLSWHSGNYSVDSLWNAYITRQEHTVKCTVQISNHNTTQLNHLASLPKWLSVPLWAKWLSVWV